MHERKRIGEERDKLFNYRPIFFVALALCFGIVFCYYHTYYDVSLRWLYALIPVTITPFFFCRNKIALLKTGAAMLSIVLFFFVGYGGFSRQVQNYNGTTAYNGEYYVSGKVVDKVEYEFTTRLLLEDVYIDGKSVDCKLNAYLPLSFSENVQLSDEILLYGTVSTDTQLFNEYGFYAEKLSDDIRYEIDADTCTVTGEQFDLFLLIRSRIYTVVYSGMEKNAAATTIGILTGDTSGMDKGLLNNVRRGGIAHVFAVSGLHVGALYAFCLLLFNKTPMWRFKKITRFILLAVILFFYGGICGYSSSVLRAIILCLVGYSATLIGTEFDFLERLGIAAIILLLLTPSSLFETGFQLSFSACLGIAFLQKRIGQVCVEIGKAYRKVFPRKLTVSQQKMVNDGDTLPPTVGGRVARSFANVLSISLAVQIATFPILLNSFGYVSGWTLLLNVLFVPMIAAAFSMLLLFVAVACLLPLSCSAFVLYVPNVLFSFVLLLFEVVDFSTFAIQGMVVSASAQIAYFGGCLFLTDKWNISKLYQKTLAILCFLVFFALFFFSL